MSIEDFLNNKTSIEKTLRAYGLSETITDSYLSSKIKIIEIYKVLNFSSKIKEKSLCNPLETMGYFLGEPYFIQGANATINSLAGYVNATIMLNQTISPNLVYLLNALKNMSASQLADYRMASKICEIPKRQLISDSDFLTKELNIQFLTNYVKKKFL